MNVMIKPTSPGADRSTMSAIIGMGRTGQAVAAYLTRLGQGCEGFDEHPVQLPDSLQIPVHVGRLDADVLAQFARVIVSPGVSWQHPVLERLRQANVPLLGDLDLFSEAYDGELIAVTGTNGKTTTVSLIATLLDTLPGGIEAAGNIGRPMLELLDGEAPRRVVLELSSFQLERSRIIHPNRAVLLNVQPDHADMHVSAAAYEAAKCRLFAAQREGDTAMLPADAHWHGLAEELAGRGVRVCRFGFGDPETLICGVQMLDEGAWRIFWHQDGETQCIPASELPARGRHQHVNLAVAAQTAADYGVSASVIRLCLTSFHGLSHRLQSLGVIGNREWFDDSKATNPDAAAAALAAFDQVVWICGGLSKGANLDALIPVVSQHVAQALVIGRDSREYAELCRRAGVPTTIAGTIEQAVRHAAHAQPGLPVLLSPAAASQDQFRDYAERGRAFAKAVRELQS